MLCEAKRVSLYTKTFVSNALYSRASRLMPRGRLSIQRCTSSRSQATACFPRRIRFGNSPSFSSRSIVMRDNFVIALTSASLPISIFRLPSIRMKTKEREQFSGRDEPSSSDLFGSELPGFDSAPDGGARQSRRDLNFGKRVHELSGCFHNSQFASSVEVLNISRRNIEIHCHVGNLFPKEC